MRIARVVGNVVSTIKDRGFAGQKLMIVDFLDEAGHQTGETAIVFDAAQSGVGDVVLVSIDGGASGMLLGGQVIADMTICGVLDSMTLEGDTRTYL